MTAEPMKPSAPVTSTRSPASIDIGAPLGCGRTQDGSRRIALFARFLPNSKRSDEFRCASSRRRQGADEIVDFLLPGNQWREKFTTFMLSAATWVKMRCRWKRGPTTSWEKRPFLAPSIIFQRDLSRSELGSPKTRPMISPLPRTSWKSSSSPRGA